jgi:hypothetical protein
MLTEQYKDKVYFSAWLQENYEDLYKEITTKVSHPASRPTLGRISKCTVSQNEPINIDIKSEKD